MKLSTLTLSPSRHNLVLTTPLSYLPTPLAVWCSYGNPRYAASENEKFAEYFKNSIAGPLLGPVMNCLAIKAQGE